MQQQLPLYALFLRLRNEGFSLGTQQYLLLIKALHHKKHLLSLDAIRNTCAIIWANSKEEIWILNRHFDLMILSELEVLKELEKQEQLAAQNPGLQPDQAAFPNQPKISDQDKKNKQGEDLATAKSKKEEEQELAGDPISDAGNTLSGSLPGQFRPMQMQGMENFLLEGMVSPITTRQMQQSWRYLRKWKSEGAKTEEDLPTTFEEVAKKGFFTQTTKTAPRVNIVELLLLVDRNGSMLPFHGLLDELVLSALNGGRFQKAGCLYFHDYPIKYFYTQPQLIGEIDLETLKNQLNARRTVVLIISDAGAARNTYSEKRVDRTQRLQAYLKKHTARQVWLNPMPRDRWTGNSAEDIQEFFPMFEINKQGLYQAIDVLRGKGGVGMEK